MGEIVTHLISPVEWELTRTPPACRPQAGQLNDGPIGVHVCTVYVYYMSSLVTHLRVCFLDANPRGNTFMFIYFLFFYLLLL